MATVLEYMLYSLCSCKQALVCLLASQQEACVPHYLSICWLILNNSSYFYLCWYLGVIKVMKYTSKGVLSRSKPSLYFIKCKTSIKNIKILQTGNNLTSTTQHGGCAGLQSTPFRPVYLIVHSCLQNLLLKALKSDDKSVAEKNRLQNVEYF